MRKLAKRFFSMMLSLVLVLTGLPVTAFSVSADDSVGAGAGETIDVAIYATPSTDYVAGWESLNGINNENFEPKFSNQGNSQGWGNWPQEAGSTHYIQYKWDSAITTDSFQVYWYDDGGGTRVPASIQFQYMDDAGTWQDLEMISAFEDVLKTNQYNTIEVSAVTTKAIRFNMTVRDDAAANGVYRWKVDGVLNDEAADMALAYAMERLAIGERMATDTLLVSQMSNGVTVTWTENHDAIVIKDGKAVITRGETDVTGTVTATLSLNGKSVTKTFNVTVPEVMDVIPDMLAKYDFSDLSGALASGSTITDISGHNNYATVIGSRITAENHVLTLPGGYTDYVQLPTGMFDNQNELTISMWIQNDQGAMWTSAFFFGKNTTSYFMINPQNPTTKVAKMCITWDGSGSEIGLAPGSNLSDGPYTGDAWTHYIAVITEDSITGYINGEKYNSYTLNNSVSDMGTNLLSYIGRSEYGDSYFKGKVKNVSIYSKAVSDVEAGQLYTEGLTVEEILVNSADALEIPEVKNEVLSTGLYDSATLRTDMLSGLVTVTWTSSNTDVIADDGTVIVPAVNTKVTLTATLAVGDSTLEKTFDIMVLAEDSTTYSITLDKENKGVDISQQLFGLFYEDINSAADGGLAAELVKNNSFENYVDVATPEELPHGDQISWKYNWISSVSRNFVVEQTNGLNENNTNYAKITGNMTLTNTGFSRRYNLNAAAIPMKAGTKFDFTMYMKADATYAGTVTVKVVNESGTAITDVQTLELVKDGTWQQLSTVLTGNTTELGKLVLTFSGAASTDVMYIDMISLYSQDNYGYGNKNYAYGKGLRPDLVQMLMDLKPSFIRFPGGCVVEGDMGRHGFYDWENSVGPLEERKATANYWSKHELNGYADGYGYMMSYEFGYHEILTLCEDMGAEPFPILSAGIFCQFRNSADPATGEELDEFAMRGVHLLDYCWGDPNSTDEQEAYWAGKRVENGHEEPFNLKYMGIGNENWNEAEVDYYGNFTYIKDIIEAYAKEHYPERTLTIISSTGPYAEGSIMDNAWNWVDADMPGETLVDEHYYVSLEWMLNNTHRYDSYDRLDEGGSNVFVGEYAVNSSINTLEAAIAEAAYITGFERNGDIVRHASYAPLLCKDGCDNWSPNLIYFDEYQTMATPNYYVQKMSSNNYGKTLVNTDLSLMTLDNSYEPLADTQMDIYQVSSMDEDYIYLKLVNHDDYVKDITLNYPGVTAAEAEVICLTGEANAVNYLGDEVVAPVTTKAAMKDGKLIYQIPAMSYTVIKVSHSEKAELPYIDVAEDAWYYDAVYYNYFEGFMAGRTMTIFDPDVTLTRAEFASVLYAANGMPEVEYDDVFSDVPEDAWFAKAVIWANKQGIVNGYGNRNFGPADPVVREQMAIMMYNYALAKEYKVDQRDDLSSFADASDVSDYAKETMRWAVGAGVINGKEDGTKLDSYGAASRAECAAIIQNFMENCAK